MGLCKEKKNSKITMEVGGWVTVQVSLVICVCVENRTKIALNQYWYVGEVYHVYSVCMY